MFHVKPFSPAPLTQNPRRDVSRETFLRNFRFFSFIVIPAKAGIHNHRPAIMDAGFRRHDSEGGEVAVMATTPYPRTSKLKIVAFFTASQSTRTPSPGPGGACT